MQKVRLLALATASFFVGFNSHGATLDDIQFWAGSGANRAALVLDWNDGKASESMVWGYRWEGTATGLDMFQAVVAADARLFAHTSTAGMFGVSVYGIGYDLNANGVFGVTPSLAFDGGGLAVSTSPNDARAATESADRWLEGWNNGFWGYNLKSAEGDAWAASFSGPLDRVLTDGAWDGYSFAPGFNFTDPSTPVLAVPEPGVWAFLFVGAAVLWVTRRKSGRQSLGRLSAMALTLATMNRANALSLDEIQYWVGTGTNRAALVIHWSAPEVRNITTVPSPAAEKSLAWGYRWDGTNNGEQMLDALFAADHRLFAVVSAPSAFGRSTFALGYDWNNNGVFGVRNGTNVLARTAFTNGLYVGESSAADSPQSLDAGDLLWSGWSGAYWELWQEQGGTGGFANSPDRGSSPYWTPGDPTMPWFGNHGQWDLAQSSPAGITLQNGSWIGYTVAAGGFNFLDENDPGTVAYNFHKHAPLTPVAAGTNSAFAAQLVSAVGPFGGSPYNEPASVLGAPATRYFESNSKPATRVKLVESPYNYSVANGQTNKLLLTLNTGSAVIARFDRPILDNPANPYGVDFQVFGNTFFSGSGFSSDTANMNTFNITGGSFSEPLKVSVSPGFSGLPGEVANDASTWPWYRYENGPYGDSVFPTHAYKWNRAGTNWTEEVLDFTKPVNPALKARFSAGGLTVADGIDLYAGSGGGTGFDLAESGFASVQYVKVEGLTGYTGGEIDAFSIVRPMTLGDTLAIAPGNLTNDTAHLAFQKPGYEQQTVVVLDFTNLSAIAQVKAARLDDLASRAAVSGTVLTAVELSLTPILGNEAVSYAVDLKLSAGGYAGDGSDLLVLQANGTNWNYPAFTFNATNHQVTLAGVTNLSPYVVVRVVAPPLKLAVSPGSSGLSFAPVTGFTHALERSTNLVNWDTVHSFIATNGQPVTLQDAGAPADRAFYRLRIVRP